MNKRIMQARKEAKLNQDDFAAALGLTKNFISLVETGKREPSERTVRDICRIFNINETWLRTGEGEMYLPKTMEEEIAEFTLDLLSHETDSFRMRFIKALAKLSDEEWAVIEKIFSEVTN